MFTVKMLVRLTFSEWQANVGSSSVAEQNERLRTGSRWKVDHLHVALQGQVVTQIHEALLLHPNTSLRRHVLLEHRYSV